MAVGLRADLFMIYDSMWTIMASSKLLFLKKSLVHGKVYGLADMSC